MKKMLSLAAAALFSVALVAQSNPIDRYYQDWSNDTAFTKITFSGKMFEMANHIEGESEDEKEMLETFRMIEGICILMQDGEGVGEQAFLQARKRPDAKFENLVTIEDQRGKAEVLISEANGSVDEVIVIAGGKEGIAVVGVWGDIELNKLANLAREMQVEMMKDFDADAAKAGKDVSFFPNPAGNGPLTVDLPEELKDARVQIFDQQGRMVTEQRATGTRVQLSTTELADGNYVLAVTKGNNRVFSEQLIVRK
jgi:hypothetical protein